MGPPEKTPPPWAGRQRREFAEPDRPPCRADAQRPRGHGHPWQRDRCGRERTGVDTKGHRWTAQRTEATDQTPSAGRHGTPRKSTPSRPGEKGPPKNRSQDTTGHSTVLQCYRGQPGRGSPHEQRHAPSVEMRPRTEKNRAWPCRTNGTPSPMGRRYYLRPLFLRGEEGPEVFRMKSKNFFAFRYARPPATAHRPAPAAKRGPEKAASPHRKRGSLEVRSCWTSPRRCPKR